MPRLVRTARGQIVDLDVIIVKQQLAQAPMNLEVSRRKKFIDARELSPRVPVKDLQEAVLEGVDPDTLSKADEIKAQLEADAQAQRSSEKPFDFEVEDAPPKRMKPLSEPVIDLPERKRK